MRYNVLILHGIDDFGRERSTSVRHALSIENYSSGHRFIYHHISHDVSDELRSIAFDIIVLDVTFLCWRWIRPREAFFQIREKYRWIGTQDAFCIALPQDEYDHSLDLDQWLVDLGTDCVYSCFPDEAKTLYPLLTANGVPIVASHTGLIDALEVERYRNLRRNFAERSLDIGYRVRRLPANFGRFGILKSELGRRFAEAAKGRLKIDISDDPKDTLLGEAWPRFLSDCRFILGCESGSSVIDYTGEIKDRVDAYIRAHPNAGFEEVHSHCISPLDEQHTLAALSPRTFEIAMAGACPILVEGSYGGLLQPNIHYIPVAKDLSNIDEVIDRLGDHETAQKIALNAEAALLNNPELRYENWVEGILQRASEILASRPQRRTTTAADFERLARGHYRAVSARLTREKQEALESLSRKFNDELTAYQDEIKRLNDIYPAHIAQLNEVITSYEAEISRLNTSFEAEIARLNASYSSALETHEMQRAELEARLAKITAHPMIRVLSFANRILRKEPIKP